MTSMRQLEGLSGFPKIREPFDTFGVGHSSTSISAAMGMALAAQRQGIDRKVIAAIETAQLRWHGLKRSPTPGTSAQTCW